MGGGRRYAGESPNDRVSGAVDHKGSPEVYSRDNTEAAFPGGQCGQGGYGSLTEEPWQWRPEPGPQHGECSAAGGCARL